MMVLYSKEDFDKKLSELGLKNTGIKTNAVEFWVTKEGKHVSVPMPRKGFQTYPHYLFEEVVKQLERLAL